MPGGLEGSKGGGCFLIGEVPPVQGFEERVRLPSGVFPKVPTHEDLGDI